jgi:hypothetical protein
MDHIDVTPKTEEEFLTMVEMHNLYHSHEPEEIRGVSFRHCRVCHMPLEKNNKGLETISRKGNTSVYESTTSLVGFGMSPGQYNPLWALTWYLKTREFNMVDALLRYRWQDTLSTCDRDELRERFLRWFNPVYAMRNGIKSQQWARAAYIYALRVSADDVIRHNASMDPEWALTYAQFIDRTPHDDTRDGACRHMDTAIQYASAVDKGYHPKTLAKALETCKTSLEYLNKHYAGGKYPDMQNIVKARWVRDAETGMKYAAIVGAEDDTRDMAIATKNAISIYRYAEEIDKGPRDDTRAAIIATGSVDRIFRYALMIDKCGRDDTRAACLADPNSAYDYALRVDCGPRDDTRTAACKASRFALAYAQNVDKGPNDETRIAASSAPGSYALEYALTVDNGPHDVTRTGACNDPGTALQYARRVDRVSHPFTRWAACAHSSMALEYAAGLNDYSECLRVAACRAPYYALQYAMVVDKRPSDYTREAASFDCSVADSYHAWEMEWYSKYVPELFEGQPDMAAEVRTQGIKLYVGQAPIKEQVG